MARWRSRLAILLALAFVDGSARAEIYDFLVPTRPIYPGEALRPSDFVQKKFMITPRAARNYVLKSAQLDEMEAVRMLSEERPVSVSSIRRVSAVRKGQQVDAEYNQAGIRIQARLVALEDGAEGTEIAARNPMSGRTVRARVRGDGVLEVIK